MLNKVSKIAPVREIRQQRARPFRCPPSISAHENLRFRLRIAAGVDRPAPGAATGSVPNARRSAADGRLEHRSFSDFPGFLKAGDLLVVNNTRVIPARVFGRKPATGGKVEILLLEELGPELGIFSCTLRAARRSDRSSRWATGKRWRSCSRTAEKGRATIKIESERPWLEVLEEIGEPPLPPYIKRSEVRDQRSDRERYQTVYANIPARSRRRPRGFISRTRFSKHWKNRA